MDQSAFPRKVLPNNMHVSKVFSMTTGVFPNVVGVPDYPITLEVPWPVSAVRIAVGYSMFKFQSLATAQAIALPLSCNLLVGNPVVATLGKLVGQILDGTDVHRWWAADLNTGSAFEYRFPRKAEIHGDFKLSLGAFAAFLDSPGDENTSGTLVVDFEFIDEGA